MQTVAHGPSLRFALWFESPNNALDYRAPKLSHTGFRAAHPACVSHSERPRAIGATLVPVSLGVRLPRLANLHPVPLPGLTDSWPRERFRALSRSVGESEYTVTGWLLPVEKTLSLLRDFLRSWLTEYGPGFISPHATIVTRVLDEVLDRVSEGPLLPSPEAVVSLTPTPLVLATYTVNTSDSTAPPGWVPPFALRDLHRLQRDLASARFLSARYDFDTNSPLENFWETELLPARLGIFLVESVSALTRRALKHSPAGAFSGAIERAALEAVHREHGSCVYPFHPLFSAPSAPQSHLHAWVVSPMCSGHDSGAESTIEPGLVNPRGDFLPVRTLMSASALRDRLFEHDGVVWKCPAEVLARDLSLAARGPIAGFRAPEIFLGSVTVSPAEARELLALSPVNRDRRERSLWLEAQGFSPKVECDAIALTAAAKHTVTPFVRLSWRKANDEFSFASARFMAAVEIVAGRAVFSLESALAGLSLSRGDYAVVEGLALRREALEECVELARARQKVIAKMNAGGGVSFVRALCVDDAVTGENRRFAPSDFSRRFGELLEGIEAPRAIGVDALRDFEGTLRPYQLRGVAWLTSLASQGLGGCLADDMGLGKTAQVLASLVAMRSASRGSLVREREVSAALVLCPTAVLSHWQVECIKFVPTLRVRVHRGRERAVTGDCLVGDCELVLTSYALARLDAVLFRSVRWSVVIFDEAQALKNPRSHIARLARSLDAGAHFALTGTPIENSLRDLWSIFSVIAPGLLGDEAHFTRVFEVPIRKVNHETIAKLKRRVAPFMLRRRKTDHDVALSLPPVQVQDVVCELTVEQVALYRAVCEALFEGLEDKLGERRRMHVLAAVTRLKEVCAHPEVFERDRPDELLGRSGKFDRAVEIVEEALLEGQKSLVFTHSLSAARCLCRAISERTNERVGVYHGGLDESARSALITEFQCAERPKVLVVSLRAGGAGISLTAASTVVHFDRWWNPAVEDQATARAHRYGQTRAVNVYRLMSRETLEERIGKMLDDKRALAGAVLTDLGGHGAGWITDLDDEALRRLLGLGENSDGAEG